MNKKLADFEGTSVHKKHELHKRFKTIIIDNPDFIVIFVEDSSSVRYFEFKCDIYHLGNNLYQEEFEYLKEFYKKLDPSMA